MARPRKTLSLQWHLTDRCGHRCSHCYLFDEATWSDGAPREMPLADCLVVIEQFADLCRTLGTLTGIDFEPRFILSGGDPLLHADLWAVLEAIHRRGHRSMILGNADLLDAEVAARLRDLGVGSYQLSLDGLEATHDRIRGPGSFARALEGLEVLRRAGLAPQVMATVFRENMGDLAGLIELAAERRVASFAFARATAYGNARQLDLDISPAEYRALLLEVREVQQRLIRGGTTTRFPDKDHLWSLLRWELGEYRIYPHLNPGRTVDGCHMGQTFLVLLADGTALACRRFHSPVGRFPERSLSEIFLRSPQLAEYRRVRDLERCRSCELLYYCRGCPAVAHGRSDDWRAPDPQCWRG